MSEITPSCECPDAAALRALLDGTLPDDQQATTQAHVDRCPACEAVLRQMTAGGESWIGIAEKLKGGCEDDPKLAAALERLKADEGSAGESSEPAADAQRTLDFLQPVDDPKLLGKLGQHEISEVVGWGGMGVVLKAYDPSLHRVVAVKVLASHLAHHAVARKRFIREAQAAAAVCHDNVITIHAIDESGPQPKIVMQFVAGGSLQERIDQEGPLELKEILRIAMQTAAGLAAAHAQGVVHRDVKPANILLENGVQRVKLTDFGLARVMDDASLTLSGVIAGTPQYMAPEQAWGRDVDARADLFSLGAAMYAMCSGHSPFRARTTMAVLKRVCEDAPRPLRAINPDIPDWLVAIIEKLLAKKPEDRFQSATEVSELLSRWLAHVQQPNVVPAPAVVAPFAQAQKSTKTLIADDTPNTKAERASQISWAWMLPPMALLLMLHSVVFSQTWSQGRSSSLSGSHAVNLIGIQLVLAAAQFAMFRWAWNVARTSAFVSSATLLAAIGGVSLIFGTTSWNTSIDLLWPLRAGLFFQVASSVVYLIGLLLARPLVVQRSDRTSRMKGSLPADESANDRWQLSFKHSLWPMLVTATLLGVMLVHIVGETGARNLDGYLGFCLIQLATTFVWCSVFRAAWNTQSWLVWIGAILFLPVAGSIVLWPAVNVEMPLAVKLVCDLHVIMAFTLWFGLLVVRPLLVRGSGNWMSERLTGWQRLFAITFFTIVGAPLVLVVMYWLSYSTKRSPALNDSPVRTTIAVPFDDSPNHRKPGSNDFPKPQLLSGTARAGAGSGSDMPVGGGAASASTNSETLKPLLGRWVVVSSEGAALGSAPTIGDSGGGISSAAPSAGMFGGAGSPGSMAGGFAPPSAGASVSSPPLQWIEFAADHVIVFDGRQAKLFAEFTEDAEPKQITLRDQSNPLSVGAVAWRKGIFRLERDRLIVCWTTGERLPPTEFVTEDHYAAQLLILRREWNPPADFDPVKTAPPRAVIPFTADEAKRYQEAWARSANVPVETTNSLGMKLRVLPARAFDPAGAEMLEGFQPGRVETTLSRPLYVAVEEVTVAQFRKFVEATGYETSAEHIAPEQGAERFTWRVSGIVQDSDQHPVVRVSWQDAQAFCRWLSDTEKQSYRVPTVAEWAFAARAGVATKTRIKSPTNARLKFFDTTAPVGGDTANPFGLHDLFGNVGELISNPSSENQDVQRCFAFGGSFRSSTSGDYFADWLILRSGIFISAHFDDVGFRVVREVQPTATVPQP